MEWSGRIRRASLVGLVLLTSLGLCSSDALAQAKSSPEALQIYSDAANFQNNGAFDLAVEEWSKFVEQFPDDPLAAKAQHYLGVCQNQLKKFDKAIEAWEKVIADHPKFELRQDAYLNLGSGQFALAQGGDATMFAKSAASFGARRPKADGHTRPR